MKLFLRVWNSTTITQWGNYLIASLRFIILAPFILSKFTPEVIAVWYMFMTILNIGSLLDFGFAPTFSRLVSFVMGGATNLKHFLDKTKNIGTGKPNWNVMQKLYGTIGIVYVILTVISAFLLGVFGTWSIRRLVSQIDNQQEVWLAWVVVCVTMVIIFYGKKFENVLLGMNYVALVNRWNILFGSLSVIGALIVLMYKPSLMALVLVIQLLGIAAVIRNRFLLRSVENKRFKQFKAFSFDKQIFKATWRPAWRSGVGMLSSQGVSQGSGIIFAQVGQSAEIAIYLFAVRIISMIQQISLAPFTSKMPYFSRLRAEGKITKLKCATNKKTFYSISLFSLTAGCAVLLANPLLSLIGSNIEFISTNLWILLMVVWIIDLHNFTRIQLHQTTNLVVFWKYYALSGLLYLVLLYFTLEQYGVIAVILFHLISRLIVFNWQPTVVSLKSVEGRLFNYIKQVLLPSIIIFAITLLVICIIL